MNLLIQCRYFSKQYGEISFALIIIFIFVCKRLEENIKKNKENMKKKEEKKKKNQKKKNMLVRN